MIVTCQWCGRSFDRPKHRLKGIKTHFCNHECKVNGQRRGIGISPPPITSTSKKAARLRAWYNFPPGPCSECGNPKGERHHIDENPFNNVPSNIKMLCRKCHNDAHDNAARCRRMAFSGGIANARSAKRDEFGKFVRKSA